MKEYDLNVTATQIITVEAETAAEAIEKGFYESFGHGQDSFATTEYEVVSIKALEKYT